MARMKDIGALQKKFATRAAAAAPDYVEGVKSAGQDWESNTLASEDNYAAGVQEAIGARRFGKGVARSGGSWYSQQAATLGQRRYPEGVQAAGPTWAEGATPYLQASAQPLSTPRRPKGQNQARANEQAERMRAIKVTR